MECEMVRFYGHFEGDAQTYRADGEVADLRENRDCIAKFRAAVEGSGVVEGAEFDDIDAEVRALIDEAVAEAVAAPDPELSELLTDVYVSY